MRYEWLLQLTNILETVLKLTSLTGNNQFNFSVHIDNRYYNSTFIVIIQTSTIWNKGKQRKKTILSISFPS